MKLSKHYKYGTVRAFVKGMTLRDIFFLARQFEQNTFDTTLLRLASLFDTRVRGRFRLAAVFRGRVAWGCFIMQKV